MTPERLAIEMGLDIPDFDRMGNYGAEYGTMKPYHRVGEPSVPVGPCGPDRHADHP